MYVPQRTVRNEKNITVVLCHRFSVAEKQWQPMDIVLVDLGLKESVYSYKKNTHPYTQRALLCLSQGGQMFLENVCTMWIKELETGGLSVKDIPPEGVTPVDIEKESHKSDN